MDVSCLNREMYHGSVWNGDEQFQAPMVTLSDGEHIFVRDCITFEHDTLGTTKAVIVNFFKKVCIYCMVLSHSGILTLGYFSRSVCQSGSPPPLLSISVCSN